MCPVMEKLDPHTPILVAEANFTHLSALRRSFENVFLKNLSVTGRGFRAVELSKRQEFRVIFISSVLVNLNGLQVVSAIREEGLNIATPIVFLAELEGEMLLEKAVALGATATIRKPVSEEALRVMLEKILGTQIVTEAEERSRVEDSMLEAKKAIEMARNLRAQGDFELAQEGFRRALVEVFCGLAENYLSKGDKESADEILSVAGKIDPQARAYFEVREEAFVEQGRKCLTKKQYMRARAEFQAALTMNDQNVSALFGLGEAFYGLNDLEEARRLFERVLDSKTTIEDPQIYKQMGLTACRRTHYDIAHQALDRAMRMFPADAKLFYCKAVAYVAAGAFEDAVPYLNKALRIEPGFAEARALDHKVKKWAKAKKAPSAQTVADLNIH